MEDYIFILIAIVLTVIGALNKQKKKQEAEMGGMDEEENPSHSFFDRLFADDSFMMGESSDNLVPPPVVQKVPKRKEKMVAPPKMEAPAKMEHKPLVHQSLTHSYVRPERKRRQALEIEKLSLEDEAKLTPKNLIRKDFSLRKAVIFSEILNRRF